MKRAAFALLPGALVVWLAFNGGGFFAGEPALLGAGLCAVLILRVTVASEPGEGLGPAVLVAAAALALLCGWTLASGLWSDAPGRALLEFDRILLYLLVLVFCGSFVRTPERVRWLVRGIAAAAVIVCGIAFVTRALPEVWPITPNIHPERLSYPITYWNALGLLAGLGFVLCFAITSDAKEHAVARVLAAASLPVLGPTLLLTFSRGAVFATIAGLAVFALAARPRGFPAAFLAAAPPTVLALLQTWRAHELDDGIVTRAAIAEGQDLALVVALCIVAAAILRALALRLDVRMLRVQIPTRLARRVALPAAILAVAAAAPAAVALDVGDRVGDQYDKFTAEDQAVSGTGGGRFLEAGNNGRLENWGVSVDAFEREPIHGSGAGTWQLQWNRERDRFYSQVDAHSLYAEMLGELGIVGISLLAAFLVAVFVGVGRRIRGEDRALYGGILAACLVWALAAATDWHWEMPVVTLPFFALGGAALASSRGWLGSPGRTTRVLVGAGLIVVAVTPARVAVSQARLDDAVQSFRAGDCAAAIDSALASSSALGARAEPFEILGWCDARLGYGRLAERMMRAAIERDPDNWELWYGLALVRAADRRDPLPAARRALRLDPVGEVAKEAVRRFRTRDPSRWERWARSARLPLR